MSVDVRAGATFETGVPTPLFRTHPRQAVSAMDFFTYDVSPDGKKFLINTKVDVSNTSPLSVILNWASELEH